MCGLNVSYLFEIAVETWERHCCCDACKK